MTQHEHFTDAEQMYSLLIGGRLAEPGTTSNSGAHTTTTIDGCLLMDINRRLHAIFRRTYTYTDRDKCFGISLHLHYVVINWIPMFCADLVCVFVLWSVYINLFLILNNQVMT